MDGMTDLRLSSSVVRPIRIARTEYSICLPSYSTIIDRHRSMTEVRGRTCLAHKWAGYWHEGHLGGLNQPAGYPLGAGLCTRSRGLQPDGARL